MGIEWRKSSGEGRTAVQGARVEDVSRERSAARRPWTVMLPRGLETDLETVSGVRRALVGTVMRILPAWFGGLAYVIPYYH